MNKMVEELESREKEWKNTPMAARNRMLQKKWKDKIKVKIAAIQRLIQMDKRAEVRLEANVVTDSNISTCTCYQTQIET